jgi:hypothetical protein
LFNYLTIRDRGKAVHRTHHRDTAVIIRDKGQVAHPKILEVVVRQRILVAVHHQRILVGALRPKVPVAAVVVRPKTPVKGAGDKVVVIPDRVAAVAIHNHPLLQPDKSKVFSGKCSHSPFLSSQTNSPKRSFEVAPPPK